MLDLIMYQLSFNVTRRNSEFRSHELYWNVLKGEWFFLLYNYINCCVYLIFFLSKEYIHIACIYYFIVLL